MIKEVEYTSSTGKRYFIYDDSELTTAVNEAINITDMGGTIKGCINISDYEHSFIRRIICSERSEAFENGYNLGYDRGYDCGSDTERTYYYAK